ncbi:MAG: C10 family peptidase, partial [Synergistaceae bacterium]|nr:C10 family peptidase [Synergistaceae bacterium]
MKARKRFIAISLFFVCLASRAAFAVPTTPAQAENVVRGWLIYDSSPFGKLAGEFSKVESYGESGKTSNPSEALYYAVHLDPSGIVLLPADDELNPITAYASDADWYGPEPANPLYDTIGASIAEMVKVHRGDKRRGSGVSEARERWATFQDLALSGAKRGDPLAGEPSTVIVGPLLSTTWNQKGQIEEGSEISYNEYTPNNYPAGCGAVMMAQIMKHFGYPTAAISDLTGDKEFYYTVGGQPKSSKLMGGNGNGEPYDISGPTADQIARLIADCAVAIGSDFAKDATGSNPALIAESLVNTFRYGNAVLAMPDPSDDK